MDINNNENKNESSAMLAGNGENEGSNNAPDKNTAAPIKPPKKSFMEKQLDKLPSLGVKNYKLIVVLFAVVSIALSVFRVFVIENSVEKPGFISENTYYKLENTPYTKLFLMLCVVCGFAALIFGIFSRKTNFWENKHSNGFVFVSSLTGFCMVGCSGFFVYRIALNNETFNKLDLLSIILMLMTGAYFVMEAVGFISKEVRPFCYVGVVVFSIVRLMANFIELHDSQHVSSNEYHLVGLVALLLFFTSNARGNIDGKPSLAYPFFGLLSMVLLWVYSLPEIYVLLYEPYYVDRTFIFCIIDAALGMYVCAKLLSVKDTKGGHSA